MTEQQKRPAPKRTAAGQKAANPQQRRPATGKPANSASTRKPQQKATAARAQSASGQKKVAAKKSSAGNAAADNKGGLHGVEALAALTVAETKYSRFKGRVILGLTLLLMVSLGWNSVQSAFRPEPKLLALTQDGRVQPLPLLDEPIESRQILMDWTRRNIPELFSFNYVNYIEELQDARDFTQPITLERFRKDIEEAGILTKVTNEFLILRANITNEPNIINETVTNGRRIWVIEVPVDLIYDSGEVKQGERRRINQKILFTAWIARANVMEYDGGLMLAKYSIKTRRD